MAMTIDYENLPVYAQKEKILECLESNQVVIVESPTGSGKTTQIPVILYEAGYATGGMIGVTQPRRIAALSVSEFISHQLGTSCPGLVGYKMRFEDFTNTDTRIKIMTDGILLQEMKLDPSLSKYSVLMIDEAHERSLNIDFVLGLVKRVLKERSDFHVIVSSATMNTQAFSDYFDNAPIVSIDTVTYPVSVIYDPVEGGITTSTQAGCEKILTKIRGTVGRVLDNDDDGGILIFLPGEKIIKDCMDNLLHSNFGRRLHILPLYGRLSKEEQERVFERAPEGKRKVVISTNIAETSVTISDITTVIDSGLCKLNFYSPRTFTSSLIETQVSKASCNQRKGRAGRTHAGFCYRLYSREDFDGRPEYTTEEIYRTDLSEVVLRMCELGITDFYGFDFIASPGSEGIIGAVDTLNMLGALDNGNTLSSIGNLMVSFPLEPRISRIIVEAIMRYPECIEDVLIASAFLSAHSPFVLPPNEEMEARKAHHRFQDAQGDFCAYLNLYRAYKQSDSKERFCKKNYLDERVMAEIDNIKFQLTEIVSDKLGIPVTAKSGNLSDFLCCIASGMIQFVCVRTGREAYKSLTAAHICIHPGSVMFRQNPVYIVAGEIVRTSRIFAMSVSPLTRDMLDKISPDLSARLMASKESARKSAFSDDHTDRKDRTASGKKGGKIRGQQDNQDDFSAESALSLGGILFETKKIKGKKTAILPLDPLIQAIGAEKDKDKLSACGKLKGVVTLRDGGTLLNGEDIALITQVAEIIDLRPLSEKKWNRKMNVSISQPLEKEQLIDSLEWILRIAIARQKDREYGFITLHNNSNGSYWFRVSRGFTTALMETHASLERLVEENVQFSKDEKERIGRAIALVNTLYK